jgi:hypothetical protein
MAKIPYQPWSTEQPIASSGATGFNVRATEDAFGTNVANAIAHAGTMVEGAGNELYNRAVAMKQLDNEAEARQITNDAELNLATLRVGYANKEGAAAKDGFNDYQTAVKGVYEDSKAKASNPAVSRMVDGQTASEMRSSIFAGATHAAQQTKAWQMNTLKNRFDSYKNRVLSDPDNEGLWAESTAETAKIIGQLSDYQGEPPDSDNRKHDLAAALSDLWSTRIKGRSSKDPEGALAMLTANRDKILGQDVDKIEDLVTNRFQMQVAARIAHSSNSGFAPYMDPSHLLRFNGVDERLQRVFQRAQEITGLDTPFTIGDKGGVRTVEEQRRLVQGGFSRTMHSNHLLGRAFDVVPLDENGKPNYNDRAAYDRIDKAMFQAAQELGIELGPEHNQIKSWDPGHYSLPRGAETGQMAKYQAPTLQQKVDRAKAYYAKLRPGDDVGLVKVENAVIAQHGKFEQIARNQFIDDKQTIATAVMSGGMDQQPQTMQDLLSRDGQVPGLREAVERTQQQHPEYMLQLERAMYSKKVHQDDDEERLRLRGLADNEKESFLDEDIVGNPKLTRASKETFLAQQKRLRASDSDPRVPRAINWLKQSADTSGMMTEQGVFRRDKQNEEEYDKFSGAMHEALEAWTDAHGGKSPTEKEVVKEIGPAVLRRRITEQGLPELHGPGGAILNWMFGDRQRSMLEQVLPEDMKDAAKAEFMKEHDWEPSDREIYKAAVRMQFDKLFGAPKKAPKPKVPETRSAEQ